MPLPVFKPIKSRSLALCLAAVICFALSYGFTFDKKINLGGDNLSYYYLGKSLAQGTGYSDISSPRLNPHTHFPPGYPNIVAVILVLFDGVIPVKIANGLFGTGVLIIGFFLFRRIVESEWLSFTMIMVIALNRHFLEYSWIMMSEMPFMFFLMLGCWLFTNIKYDIPWYSNRLFLSVIIVSAISYYIRSFGIVLIAAIVAQSFANRKYSYGLVAAIGFTVLVVPWSVRNSMLTNGGGYLNQLLMVNPYDATMGTLDLFVLVERVFNNAVRYCDKEIPYLLLNWTGADYSRLVMPHYILLSIVLLALIAFGLISLRNGRFFFISLTVSSAGILLLWPSEWFGVRFLLPMLVIMMGFMIYGLYGLMNQFFSKDRAILLVNASCLILICAQIPSVLGLSLRSQSDYPKRFRDYFEASLWIKENTPKESVVVCRKPLLSFHFSGRPSIRWPNTSNQKDLLTSFKDNEVDYIIVDVLGYASTGENILPLFRTYPHKLEILKKMDVTPTFIGQHISYLGYTGTMENGKKNGYGLYNWPNGTSYRGEWKDDFRHGRGTLKTPGSKNIIHGIWVNDTLISIVNK